MKTFAIVLVVGALFLFTGIDMQKEDRIKIEKMEADILQATHVLDSLLLEGIRMEGKIDSLAIALQEKEIELKLKNK